MAFTKAHADAPYLTNRLWTEYLWNEGLLHLPVAVNTESAVQPDMKLRRRRDRIASEICRMHQPYGIKIVTWQAERLGAEPVVPAPEPPNDNEILFEASVILEPPDRTANEAAVHRGFGTWKYMLLKPIWMRDGLQEGSTDYDSTLPKDNIFHSVQYRQMYVTDGTEDEPTTVADLGG